MAHKLITRDSVQERYWELGQFLGCYLHEDWPEMHGSPEGAVDDAIAEATPERLRNAFRQFRQITSEVEDDVDLRRVLNDCLGVNVLFRKPRDARNFADNLARKLEGALKGLGGKTA